MAITVLEDTSEGSELSSNSQGDNTLSRTFIVTGVDSSPVTGRVVAAQEASGIPVHGDTYPAVTPTVRVLSKTCTALDEETFKVVCNYGRPGVGPGSSHTDSGSTMEFSGSSTQEETNLDAEDSEMVLGTLDWWQSDEAYSGTISVVDIGADDNRPHVWELSDTATEGKRPKDDQGNWTDNGLEWNNGAKSKQNVMVQKYKPVFRMRLSRRETSNPAATIRDYTSTINSASVTIGGIVWDEGLLFCESITATTTDEGERYSVVYNFIYNPQGWKLKAIYTADDGYPTPDYEAMDLALFEGSKEFDLYESTNFSSLDL